MSAEARATEGAIATLEAVQTAARGALGDNNAIEDTLVRLRALRCWIETQRSVAAWVVGVHGYLDSEDDGSRAEYRALLDGMMERELENTDRLIELLDSDVELLATTDRIPLLIVCVFRPEMEHGCWHIKEIAARRYHHRHTDLWLQPLSAAESETLVGHLLHIEALLPDLRERILGRYLQGVITRDQAIELAGIDWVDLAERQHKAMLEDLAWAMEK